MASTALVLAGCGGGAPRAQDGLAGDHPTAQAAQRARLEERRVSGAPGGFHGAWGWLEARPFALLPVPDPQSWVVLSTGRWFVAEHRATGSTLSARVWAARRTVTQPECEQELLLGQRDLRELGAEELIEERRGVGPAGFDGRLRVFGRVEGWGAAWSVGAGPGRCYAIVFRTRIEGGNIEGRGVEEGGGGNSPVSALGERLGLAADRILPRARLVGIEELRGPRRPAPRL